MPKKTRRVNTPTFDREPFLYREKRQSKVGRTERVISLEVNSKLVNLNDEFYFLRFSLIN